MASGIITCTGEKIMLGDKVKTPAGNVIKVCGAMISHEGIHNAEQCEKVADDTPTGWPDGTSNVEYDNKKAAGKTAMQAAVVAPGPGLVIGDCVVWGGD